MGRESETHLCPLDELVPRALPRLLLTLERPPLLALDDVLALHNRVVLVLVDVDRRVVEALEEVPQVVDGEALGLLGAPAGVARGALGAVAQLRARRAKRSESGRRRREKARIERKTRRKGRETHRLERLVDRLLAELLDALIALDRLPELVLGRLLADLDAVPPRDALEEDEALLGGDVEVVDAVPEQVER